MATKLNPDEEFQKKIDRAFPANGIIALPPADSLKELILANRQLALVMLKSIPHSRERSLAFSRLEEQFLWDLLGIMRT